MSVRVRVRYALARGRAAGVSAVCEIDGAVATGLRKEVRTLSPHSHNTKCYLRKWSLTRSPSLVIVPTKSPITSDFYKNHFHRKIQLRAIARSQPGLF